MWLWTTRFSPSLAGVRRRDGKVEPSPHLLVVKKYMATEKKPNYRGAAIARLINLKSSFTQEDHVRAEYVQGTISLLMKI